MIIKIKDAGWEICEQFGRDVCASYVAGNKDHSRSMYVQGKPRIDQDPAIQCVGRVAEVAVCKMLGLDPMTALDWGIQCDIGADIVMTNGQTIDVKASSHPNATRLIWPVSKNHFLHKAANHFVFAKVDTLRKEVDIVGAISKQDFITKAKNAHNERGIVNGTRYMNQQDLIAVDRYFAPELERIG